MSGHTPGPWVGQDENGKFKSDHQWRAEDYSTSSSECAPIWAGDKVIALVVHSSDVFNIKSHPSVEANARLIAAAPDLLEALKAIVAAHAVPSSVCAERPAYEAARTAIAKATGGAV